MVSLANMYRTLLTQRAAVQSIVPVASAPARAVSSPLTSATGWVVGAPGPVREPAPALSPAAPPAEVPDGHSCGGRCGSLPSSSTPATAGWPGATPAALPAPSLSLSTVGSTQLPPPAGSVLAKDSAPPKGQELGAWLQNNGGLWLWVIVAIVLIVVLAPGSGRRSTW